MFSLETLKALRENNRIEAKKARGGLPESIWESYSAFANTLGGVILLGVIENKDYSLSPVGVPSAQKLVDRFWELLPKMASANILLQSDVKIEKVEDNEIVVITVPRARRTLKPIYIGGNVYTGSYKRDGEGDYRLSLDEVESMLSDSKRVSFDMQSIEDITLDRESISLYEKLSGERVGSPLRLGDVLLLGRVADIRRLAPCFKARYTYFVGGKRQVFYGDNLVKFYIFCRERIFEKAPYPKDTAIRRAIFESVVNAILNADYHMGGVECVEGRRRFTVVNSGSFCVDLSLAISGGISDVRCGYLSELFSHIVGKRRGVGISGMFALFESKGFCPPEIREQFSPDRIIVSLSFSRKRRESSSKALSEQLIIDCLTARQGATAMELVRLTGIRQREVDEALLGLTTRGIVVRDRGEYKLKR